MYSCMHKHMPPPPKELEGNSFVNNNIMAESQPNLIVKIDGEYYKLDVVPAAAAKVVLAEKEKLLCLVDLKTLVADLGRVGAFIRIAYNGVMAAGPRYTELQIEIQQLGYDITKLCDMSALTLAKFKNASSTVLTRCQATYMYLFNSYEDMAVETLSSVSKIAGDMAKAALELHDEFEMQTKKVVGTLTNTQRAKSEEAQRIEEKAKEHQELEEKQKHQQQLMEDAQRLEREAEAQRREMEAKEDEAISSIQPIDGFKKLINGLVGIEIFDDGRATAERKAKYWKQKRIEALEKENEYRQMRYDALERMTSFAAKIQMEENMAVAAVDALHEVITALKELSLVMMQVANFWKQMQEHCKSLADDQLKSVVEMAMNKYSDEERMKFWTADGFKQDAIRFYAGWVALNGVCAEHFEQIKMTQKDLYEYLKENPTYEECRRNIHKLTERFLNDLKKDQKAIADERFKIQEKIENLKR